MNRFLFLTLTLVLILSLTGCGGKKSPDLANAPENGEYVFTSEAFLSNSDPVLAGIIKEEVVEVSKAGVVEIENIYRLKNDVIVIPTLNAETMKDTLVYASKNGSVKYGIVLLENTIALHNPETGRLQGSSYTPVMLLDFSQMNAKNKRTKFENIRTSIFSYNDSYDMIEKLERFAFRKELSHPVPVIQQSAPNKIESEKDVLEWFNVFTSSRKGIPFAAVMENDSETVMMTLLGDDLDSIYFRSYGTVPEEEQITIFIHANLNVEVAPK